MIKNPHIKATIMIFFQRQLQIQRATKIRLFWRGETVGGSKMGVMKGDNGKTNSEVK